ncbi:DMT family transporter [Sulfitobacter geojensis]|uniref:DMT family transporter n=1 Tax=Sulfitobacter geojensis TaxID=1342299 RepID=A0AAE3B6Z0_9RHOB|nr:DMT family transporter [Sulfitobacter geojensis]MBM1690198.1 DMT family transporter [Sulfitobacter geojensis]MBM1694264.1 DMT family transporter [Sulfitobacter geojensis]MBM1706430.1 DMT family transporter [Sulfitobacter geojensis]MBM1710488.1 DMT family transporter [Sulfitobacter geojensis]MBM1714554.1 DMT family transporter [Sulfitobacter geojensis]
MRLALAITVTMIAFAANSVLTRMAIEGGFIDPSGFALVRVVSGALVLGMIISLRGSGLPLLRRNRIPGALSLAVYLVGFSLAYLTLDAGLGALILFGVVQVTMFAHGALRGTAPTGRQLTGGAVAFIGLLCALWPGPGGVADPTGAALMVFAGLGWAAYTIIGRDAQDPLAATSANFLLCIPILLILLAGTGLTFSATGVALGVLCGGLTSGLGYALWYAVLPKIEGATAAIVQLSVPVIAILAGALLLNEGIGPIVIFATFLVVGGIGWSVTGRAAPADRS